MKENAKISFVGDLNYTFVTEDYEILSEHYEVEVVQPPRDRKGWYFYIKKVKEIVKKADLLFGWFAGWHTAIGAFYAKKYKKPFVVVSGGYDAVSFPEIGYGAFSNIKERTPARYVFKRADKIIVVSEYLKREIIKNSGVAGDKIQTVPTGYDPDFWKPGGKKEALVLSVGSANNIKRVKVKGLDIFVASAAYVPNAEFVVIGVEGEAREYLERRMPSNVKLIGKIHRNELLPYYQRSKIYAQLSISEGLPNSLCEAMLAGDIPIGTRRGGIPEAMGNTGFYVEYGDIEGTAEAVKKALSLPEGWGLKARERIIKMFPKENRERGIITTIDSLLS